jgi:hypothetical protein
VTKLRKGDWRRLHNKELYTLYSLSNIIRIVKSRRLRRAEHVARMGAWRSAHRVFVGKPEQAGHLEEPGVDERIILKFIFEKWYGGMVWIDLAKHRDMWRTFVSTEMNHQVSGIS